MVYYYLQKFYIEKFLIVNKRERETILRAEKLVQRAWGWLASTVLPGLTIDKPVVLLLPSTVP